MIKKIIYPVYPVNPVLLSGINYTRKIYELFRLNTNLQYYASFFSGCVVSIFTCGSKNQGKLSKWHYNPIF